MGFVEANKNFFIKYATFSGRASRSEYWFVVLGAIVAGAICGILCAILETAMPLIIFELVIMIPSFALVSRRLHDTNHSFWWILLVLIPIIGSIIIIIWYCTRGTAGDNRFGPDPLGQIPSAA